MFNMAPLEMPMARADVVHVLASSFVPTKILNAGEVVGSFRQDRHSGIMGVLGAEHAHDSGVPVLTERADYFTGVENLGGHEARSEHVNDVGAGHGHLEGGHVEHGVAEGENALDRKS